MRIERKGEEKKENVKERKRRERRKNGRKKRIKERKEAGKRDGEYLSECMIRITAEMGQDNRVSHSMKKLGYLHTMGFKILNDNCRKNGRD